MFQVWNIGNTTVRNPNRIELGLKVLSQGFEGKIRGEENELKFSNALVESKIVDSEGTYASFLGRKWRSVMIQLGFCLNSEYTIHGIKLTSEEIAQKLDKLGLRGLDGEITPVGQNLLHAKTSSEIEDIFLRQLLAYEIPSPIELRYKNNTLKPFVFFLATLFELFERNEKGLNKTEIALFLQFFQNHSKESIHITVQKILEYRKGRGIISGSTKQKEYDLNILFESAEVGNVKPDTLKDYADTTYRYFQMSGLLTTDGSRVILKNEKIDLIKSILSSEPNFTAENRPFEYLTLFYSGYKLPLDNSNFAIEEISRIKEELVSLGIPVGEIQKICQQNVDTGSLRYQLLELLKLQKEKIFARDQMQEDSLTDIITYLSDVRKKTSLLDVPDKPAYLEWAVWRAFLAIDNIVNPIAMTRKFPLDDNLKPRHPAPSGNPDMVFEFNDFILAVEVTLTTSSRQEAAEGESVRRHVAILQENSSKPVLCLFLAPEIDINTLDQFHRASWYINEKKLHLNILPMTIDSFIKLIELLNEKKYTPSEFKKLLLSCLAERDGIDPIDWRKKIDMNITRWLNKMVSNNIV